MTDTWEGLGTPVQLGAELTVNDAGTIRIGYISGGSVHGFDQNSGAKPDVSVWDWPNPYSFFGSQQNQFVPGPTHSIIDMCVHEGELHVVWCELMESLVQNEEYGGPYIMGPYVAKWDGSAWVMLGSGTIDDSPYAEQATVSSRYSGGDFGLLHDWLPLDGRTYPARPRIASDGTNLYTAYTMHVTAYATNPPPVGCYWPGDPYAHELEAGEHQTWQARNVIVRRWNGSSWDLWAEILAETNNNGVKSHPATNTQFSERLELEASADEVGVCYVSFAEMGYVGTNTRYVIDPIFFVGFTFGTNVFSQLNGRLAVARCDGGTPTVKNVASFVGTVDTSSPTWHIVFVGDSYGDTLTSHRLVAEGGDCYVLWGSQATATKLTRFSDLALLTTLPPSAFSTLGGRVSEVVFSPTTSFAYAVLQTGLVTRAFQNALDGSAFENIDGSVPDVYTSWPSATPVTVLPSSINDLVLDDPNNLWAAETQRATTQVGLWEYHRNCRAWTRLLQFASGQTSYSPAALERIGDNLYVGEVSYDQGSDVGYYGTNFSVTVYRVPILRDFYSCGVVELLTGLNLQTEPSVLPLVSSVNPS